MLIELVLRTTRRAVVFIIRRPFKQFYPSKTSRMLRPWMNHVAIVAIAVLILLFVKRYLIFNSEPDHGKASCIVLSQKITPLTCPVRRLINLEEQYKYYKLSKPQNTILKYPEETKNLFDSISFPLLNQHTPSVLFRSATRSDLHETNWLIHYVGMAVRNHRLASKVSKEERYYTSYKDFANLLADIRRNQTNDLVSIQIPGLQTLFKLDLVSMKEYIKYPSQELPFHDIIKDNRWQHDDVFTLQRLAGQNPMSLRKMRREDYADNAAYINRRYDWDAAIKRASKENKSFPQMIDDNRVFIIEYKILHDVSTDIDDNVGNVTQRIEILSSRSPFAVFVIAHVNGEKKLTPVAIQTELSPDAPVYSPEDGGNWMLAKMEIQRADITYEELVEHLTKTHFLMEPICVVMRSTMAIFHPLAQIFQWHCRGLLAINSMGLKKLLGEGEFLHKLFAIGSTGGLEVVNRAYHNTSWDDTDFWKKLQERGVDNREELPYFPYRDDGLLIWKEVGDFAAEYVQLYYKNDEDVRGDFELQNFANKLSADGTGAEGGEGMLKKFPAKIESINQLTDIVKRIVFIPVQHSAVNYPVSYYAGFVPNEPTKLYFDPRLRRNEFGLNSLPNVYIATQQVLLAMSLGSLRYDVFLDYGDKLDDPWAKVLVQKYHEKLIGTINSEISTRNDKRLEAGKFVYPYFLPKWLTNSIQT